MTATLEKRIACEEARGEQLDMRLGELREDMRAGFERTDRAIDRPDRTVERVAFRI